MPRIIQKILLVSLLLLFPAGTALASSKAPREVGAGPELTSHEYGRPLKIDPEQGVTFEWTKGSGIENAEWSSLLILSKISKDYFTQDKTISNENYVTITHMCFDGDLAVNDVSTRCHVPAEVFGNPQGSEDLDDVYFVHLFSTWEKIGTDPEILPAYSKFYLFFPTFEKSSVDHNKHGSVIIQFKSTYTQRTLPNEFAKLRKKRQTDLERNSAMLGISQYRELFPSKAMVSPKNRVSPENRELMMTYVLNYIKPIDGKDYCVQLNEVFNLEYCQPNYLLSVAQTDMTQDPFLNSEGSWGQPYPDLWALDKTGVTQAWENGQGENVKVAVIDTGLDYNHPDIKNNVWINPGEDLNGNGIVDGVNTCPVPNGDFDCRDSDHNGYVDDIRGYDFSACKEFGQLSTINDAGCLLFKDPGTDPMDYNGHGTHVSGVIAAEGNNGLGIVGVAPKAKIMAVKGFNSQGVTDTASLAQSITYAVANGADVINNSWSGQEAVNPLIEQVVSIAHDLGVVVIQSAGNNFGKDAREITPQRLNKTITVGALDYDGQVADFSNGGTKVDLYAPGFEILSLNAREGKNTLSEYFTRHLLVAPEKNQFDRIITDGDSRSSYLRLNGTSLSAAYVSGISALLLSNKDLEPDQVRALLKGTADEPTASVNAAKAIMANPSEIVLDDPQEDEVPTPEGNDSLVSLYTNLYEDMGLEVEWLDLFSDIIFTPVVFKDMELSSVFNSDVEKTYLESVLLKNDKDQGWDILKDMGDKLEYGNFGTTLMLYFPVGTTFGQTFAEFLSKVNGYDYASSVHMIDRTETQEPFIQDYVDQAQPRLEETAIFEAIANQPVRSPLIMEVPLFDGQQGSEQIHIVSKDLQDLNLFMPEHNQQTSLLDILESISLKISDAYAEYFPETAIQEIDLDSSAKPTIVSPGVHQFLSRSSIEFQWSPGDREYEYYLLVGTCKDLNPCMGNIYNQELGQNLSATVSSIQLGGSDVYVKLAYRPVGEDGGWSFDLYTYQTMNLKEALFSNLESKELFPLTNPELFIHDAPKAIPFAILPHSQVSIFPVSNTIATASKPKIPLLAINR